MCQCKCGSYAINPHSHGRLPDVDLDLCDVCYWRKRAEAVPTLERLLLRYRTETPLGHQPHMIAQEVDEFLGREKGHTV